jgi:hypothetical protein
MSTGQYRHPIRRPAATALLLSLPLAASYVARQRSLR